MSNNEDVVKDFTLQDTKDIQIQSLCAFMEQMGYRLHVDGKFHCEDYFEYFHKIEPTFKGCQTIALNTAVKLHNWFWHKYDNTNYSCEFAGGVFKVDAYTLNKAQASKIVKQVFLQGTKHGRIVCHKHLVKFVYPSYQYMFLEDSQEVHA